MSAGLIGRNLAESFPEADPSRCRGTVRKPIQRVKGSLKNVRLQGWALDTSGGRASRLVLFTSQDGIVVGLARLFRRKFDPFGWSADAWPPWHGYAKADRGPIDAWAILESNEACRIAQKLQVSSRS